MIDAKARLAVPIHWGKYDLACHSWREPADKFSQEAMTKGAAYVIKDRREFLE